MAQRLRLASPRGIAALDPLAGSIRPLRQIPRSGPALLQPKEERTRPRGAGDRSCDGGQRTVVPALPGEALIEHEHLIGSTLPFANQPGPALQLGTRAYPRCSA